MTVGRGWSLFLSLASCASSGGLASDGRSDGSASESGAPSRPALAAPSGSPQTSASTAGPGAIGTASAPSSAPLTLPAGALFVYREDAVTLSFTPPRRVTLLVPSDKPCSYELGDAGNMHSGREVEAAWRDIEAQSAITKTGTFLAPDGLPVSGEAVGATGRIAWTAVCGGLCLQASPGVNALLRVLHTLAVNARGVCKV
jgi:hypothetical protein